MTLVLCSHGTSDPRGREVVRRLAAAVRARSAEPVVEAVVDVEDHRLERVLDAVEGPSVVVPLLLSGGFHVHHDVARAVRRRPGTLAAPPLGPDWSLAELGATRLVESGCRSDDVVVLGGSGSSDPRAMADVDEAARRLESLWGGTIVVGHLGYRGRPVADVVARARTSGRRVVASSYLLAPGYFQDRLEECGADLVTAPLLSASPADAVVELVLRRGIEARAAAAVTTDQTAG